MTTTQSRVIVVDDHPIVRQGLAQMIDREPDLTVCGQAEEARAALHAIATLKPDIAVIDISLGANERQVLTRITLPAIKWALVYGVVLSLARSLGEYGAVKVVSGNIVGSTQTTTLLVEERYQAFDQPTAYALAFLLAFASVICIVVVAVLRPKNEA